MVEEIIIEKFEVPENYVVELAKALLMEGAGSASALCEIIERMHYQIPESPKFFSAAGGVAASLPEKKYDAFQERMRSEIDKSQVPQRVRQFYRCLL